MRRTVCRARHQGAGPHARSRADARRKDKVVKQNNDGILYLFKKNKITFFHGRGSFAGGDANGYQISGDGAKADEALVAKHVIVATGSNPRALPGAEFDEQAHPRQ